jgi:hypothetical protein
MDLSLTKRTGAALLTAAIAFCAGPAGAASRKAGVDPSELTGGGGDHRAHPG